MKNKHLLKACASNAERKVWDLLEQLPDEYHVYAGVLGIDSECDFVISHPKKGILILEVKGGFIENHRDNGKDYITSQGRNGLVKIKNPFKQACDQSYDLKRRIVHHPEIKNSNAWVAITYGICLPDNDIWAGDYPDSFEKDRIIFKGHLGNMIRHIDRLMEFADKGGKSSFGQAQGVLHKILIPKKPTFSEIIEASTYHKSNESQSSLLPTFFRPDEHNNFLLIEGSAGSGKTTIAIEAAQKFSSEGFETLVLCYNEPLMIKLKKDLEKFKNVKVSNFHHFAEEMAKLANHEKKNLFAIEREKAKIKKSNQEFWNKESAEILYESLELMNLTLPKFDALIIDEAQDFEDFWLFSVQGALKAEAKQYLFKDKSQLIYQQREIIRAEKEFFRLKLVVNHRLPADILDLAKKFSSGDTEETQYLNLMRKRLVFQNLKSSEELPQKLEQVLNTLIVNENVRPDQVVVLSPSRPEGNEKLVEMMKKSESKKLKFEIKFRIDEKEENKVVFETIHRFKGLEAPIVILTNIDKFKESEVGLIYTALTRANVALYIMGTKEDLEKLQNVQQVKERVA